MTKSKHFLGLDWLRIITMYSICVFHVQEAFFYQDETFFNWDQSKIFTIMSLLARPLSIGGFIIIALSFFLMGYNKSLEKIKLKTFIMFFVFALACIGVLPFYNGYSLDTYRVEWDIYHLLVVNILLLFIVSKYLKAYLYLFAIIGLILLWLPVWNYSKFLSMPPLVEQITFGICNDQQHATWPLLPWSGLICFSYYLGDIAKKNIIKLSQLQIADLLVLPGLILSIPYLGNYFWNPLGPNFYCFMNRQPPLIFWSHMIWIFFIIRISLLNSVNNWLQSKYYLAWIEQSVWSRHFALSYLVQLIWVTIGLQFDFFFKAQPTLVSVFSLMLMPLTELSVRVLLTMLIAPLAKVNRVSR